jgi:hypothetical protein
MGGISIVVLLIFLAIYLIHQITFGIPEQIRGMDEKMEMLKLHFKEVNIKLDEISKKLDSQ